LSYSRRSKRASKESRSNSLKKIWPWHEYVDELRQRNDARIMTQIFHHSCLVSLVIIKFWSYPQSRSMSEINDARNNSRWKQLVMCVFVCKILTRKKLSYNRIFPLSRQIFFFSEYHSTTTPSDLLTTYFGGWAPSMTLTTDLWDPHWEIQFMAVQTRLELSIGYGLPLPTTATQWFIRWIDCLFDLSTTTERAPIIRAVNGIVYTLPSWSFYFISAGSLDCTVLQCQNSILKSQVFMIICLKPRV
jgi:hypothetical protein